MAERFQEYANHSVPENRTTQKLSLGISAAALLALTTAFKDPHAVSTVNVESASLLQTLPDAPPLEDKAVEVEEEEHVEFKDMDEGPIELGSTIYVRVNAGTPDAPVERVVPMTFSVDGKTLSVSGRGFRQISTTDNSLVTVDSVEKKIGQVLRIGGKARLRGNSNVDEEGLKSIALALSAGNSVTITTSVFILGTFPIRIEPVDQPLVQVTMPEEEEAGVEAAVEDVIMGEPLVK